MTSLEALASALPPSSEAGVGDDADRRSRATLGLLIEMAMGFCELDPRVRLEEPLTCPNCRTTVTSTSTPYCGDRCREESAFVRQLRRALTEKGALNEERQASLGQVLWHLLGGGYPARQTLVNEKARQKLFARDGGKCQLCGAPATTFDHITTACNRPINLRSVCESCTTTRQYGDEEFINRTETRDQLRILAIRIAADVPIRCCDDPEEWDWRRYLAKRKALLTEP